MTSIRQVKTVEDALLVLPVRNAVRSFMTRHRDEISESQQREWFEKVRAGHDLSLYLVEDDVGNVAGYGLIRYDQPTRGDLLASLTAGFLERYRGRGYGRLAFSFLLCEAKIHGAVPWLEVLENNVAARGLYRSLGFQETSSEAGVLKMVHAPARRI